MSKHIWLNIDISIPFLTHVYCSIPLTFNMVTTITKVIEYSYSSSFEGNMPNYWCYTFEIISSIVPNIHLLCKINKTGYHLVNCIQFCVRSTNFFLYHAAITFDWCIRLVVDPIASGVYGVGASMTVEFGIYWVGQ